MTPSTQCLSTETLHDRALRVRLVWSVDRYAQEIETLWEGGWRPALTSIEGDGQVEWPASPPFQQLSVESRDRGPVALLVGMAGKSHWSGSIECDLQAQTLAFDIACLVRTTPSDLGSSYRATEKVDSEGRLTQSGLRVSAGPLTRVTVDEDQISISSDAGDEASRTYRWKYVVHLDADGGPGT